MSSPLKNWQASFKGNLCILASYFSAAKVRIRISSYRRSHAKQAALYANPQGYPVAVPGRSQHEYGLAADLSVSPKTALSTVGSTWKSMGGYWSETDPIHFAFFDPNQWAAILASCSGKKRQTVINPYGPINAPTIGFPPGGINIPIPPENPNQPVPTPPILPNVLSVPQSQPVATTMVGTTPTVAGRGLVTIQTPVGPAVMVSVPVSTSVVPTSTSRR